MERLMILMIFQLHHTYQSDTSLVFGNELRWASTYESIIPKTYNPINHQNNSFLRLILLYSCNSENVYDNAEFIKNVFSLFSKSFYRFSIKGIYTYQSFSIRKK